MTVLLEAGVRTQVVTVDHEDAARTEFLARSLATVAGGQVDDPAWVAAARHAWADLPARLRRALGEYRRDSGESGALLVRGLPVDEAALPRTPGSPGSVQRSARVPAAVLGMIACGLGDPAGFRPEKTGALVQDVVPVPGKEDFQGNAGSVRLTFHTENAFHRHRPDFVMLLCLRADHEREAGLRTASARQVLPYLDERTLQSLFAEEYVTAAPPSFGAGGGATVPHAVLTGAPDDPDLRVDIAATEPLTPRAARALTALDEAFEAAAQTTLLAPGDLAIVDNRTTVHGRTAFRPRYDGQDRWLQRTFVLTDLRRSRALRTRNGYVLD